MYTRCQRSAIAFVVAAWVIVGCEKGPNASPRSMSGPTPAATAGETDDWGDRWSPAGPGTASPVAPRSDTEWVIVLETFSRAGHGHSAANMVRDLPRVAGALSAARVHTTPEGSMVVYGSYQSPTLEAAQRDMAWIKGLEFGGHAVFPRAMLTRLRRPAPARGLHMYDLRTARLRYPKVDPLYTMEVAVWGVFDSTLTVEEIRVSAQAYCRKLRSENLEAYFHHDGDKELSVVTVGLFDRTAIDQRSGFYSPPVDALFKRFPAHLVNGEPLNELIDRERPYLGTRVQTPRLVEVPK